MTRRNEEKGRSIEPVKNDLSFDYSTLSSSAAEFLKRQAHRIRQQAAISIIHIGNDLIGAKHYLSHGAFLNWIEAEVGIPARTAQAYMQVAQWAAHKSATVALLPPSILYFLSASSTPASFINDILTRVEAGERITLPNIREELRSLRESRREGSPSKGRKVQGRTQPDQKTWPIAVGKEVKATLQQAVSIMARELSSEDFAQVREILTSKTVLDDPELAKKIAVAFSAPAKNESDHEAPVKDPATADADGD
jgi:hypothetical protein